MSAATALAPCAPLHSAAAISIQAAPAISIHANAAVRIRAEAAPARVSYYIHPDAGLFRPYTMALLRRYMRMSASLGRVPSIVGSEFFRSRVSAFRASTFEDTVILVHDVDRCLETLDPFSKNVVARCILQGYPWDEAARLLNCSRSTLYREVPEVVDRLTTMFLERGLIAEEL